MPITRAQNPKQLEPGLKVIFGDEYKRYAEEHLQVFETDTSERAFEEETKIEGLGPGSVKAEGAAITYDSAGELWTARYTHETIVHGFAITEEAVEDNLYVPLSKRYTKSMARGMAHTKQAKCFDHFNRAFNASYTGGDGVTLCNTAHPQGDGSTISNRPTTAVDLTEASLESACIAISNWVDDRGLLIAARPKKLLISTSDLFAAERILKSPGRVETADNDLNALKSSGAIPGGYFVGHWLTDTDAWFLLTDIMNGLKYYQRVAMSQKMEGDFDTGNLKFKCRERYSSGWSNPLAVYGSPGV